MSRYDAERRRASLYQFHLTNRRIASQHIVHCRSAIPLLFAIPTVALQYLSLAAAFRLRLQSRKRVCRPPAPQSRSKPKPAPQACKTCEMARLNTRPSNVPSSRFSSETPRATPQRDSPGQENRDPNASTRDKGKARAMGPPLARSSLPTPTSDGSDASRGQKRKRAEVRFEATQGTQTELDEDEQRFTRHFDPNQDPEERRQTKRASRALEREYQGKYLCSRT